MLFKQPKINALIIVLLFSVSSLVTKGQEFSALNFLPNIPQTLSGNPAKQTQTGKLVIGIPFLSGISLSANSNLAYDHLFDEDGKYDILRLNQHLEENGNIQADAIITLFLASLKYKNHTFSFSASDRAFSNGSVDNEIFQLLGEDIIDLYGEDRVVGNSTMQLNYYKEFAFGFSTEIRKGFFVGIRPKILSGKFFFESDDINLMAETNMQDQRLEISSQGNYFLSGPLYYDKRFESDITPGDYFFQLKNLGFGIDAGIDWHINENIELSASVQDLGAINFGHKAYDMKLPRPVYYPLDSLPVYSQDPDKAIEMFVDSVTYLLEVTDAGEKRTSHLPTKLNVMGKYNINQNTAVGIHNQHSFYRDHPINILSLFATANAGRRFTFAGNLSIFNAKEIKPGLGAVYNGNWLQFYLASNNISGFIDPSSTKHLNLSFGINFLINTQ
ncbi:MAG TPA: DUF5723 family protein [Mariniphaga sp.]|nr:DUF5723 family protein [Mariniphaga sp.]